MFALRVKGESMIEDGIFDGDYIFVRKQLHANRGDIVVAMIEGRGDGQALLPGRATASASSPPTRDAADHRRKRDFKSVNLIGVVVGVYRKMRVDRGCTQKPASHVRWLKIGHADAQAFMSAAACANASAGTLAAGSAAVAVLHVHLLVPSAWSAFIYGGREEARGANGEEIDVAFEDVDRRKSCPPICRRSIRRRIRRAAEADARAEARKKPKPKKVAALSSRPTSQEPSREPEVPPRRRRSPSRRHQPRADATHEKMVDLDNDKESSRRPTRSTWRRRTTAPTTETRATRHQPGEGAAGRERRVAKSDRQDTEVGDDKSKIAELEDQKSALGQQGARRHAARRTRACAQQATATLRRSRCWRCAIRPSATTS